MGGGSGFFSAKAKLTNLVKPIISQKLVCVDVGGVGDCGFRSVAAAIIDNILSKPRANKDLARKLLELLPQQQVQRDLLTPAQRLAKRLEALGVSTPDRAKFLSELAFVLRQIAVDELCAHPELYRGAFVENGKDEGTSPGKMRQQGTWIDESAIAALSNALQLPIGVQVVAPGKEIPLCLNYNTALKEPVGSLIVMQLQNNRHYMPLVNEPDYFEGINKQVIDAVTPTDVKLEKKDPELSEILAKIAVEDKRLEDEFEHNKTWLSVLVEDGDITKESLLAIYIKGMKKSDYLQGRIQHGNQYFFEAINAARKGGVEPIVLPQEKNHDKQVIEELVHAIARAISIGHLDPQLVEDAAAKFSLNYA